MEHVLKIDFFLNEMICHLNFYDMFNLKFVDSHCCDKIRYENLLQFYIDSRVKLLFGNRCNEFIEFMKTCNVKFDDNFIIQCILKKFWDDSDIILKRCYPKTVSRDKFVENECYFICTEDVNISYSLYDLWHLKIKIYETNYYATTNIIGVITDFKFSKQQKKVQILHFIKKMNENTIIVYENFKGKWENYYFACLERMKNFYNMEMKIKPIGKYIVSWYGTSPEVGHVVVYHKQQNKYVFYNKVGKIEDNQIRRWGFFSPRTYGGIVKFAFHITINNYICDDYYCALKEITYEKHFHSSIQMSGEKYYDYLTVIEYCDVPVLSKYSKFFNE